MFLKYLCHDTLYEYKYESYVFKVSVMLTLNVRQGVLLKDPCYLALTGVSQKILFTMSSLAIVSTGMKYRLELVCVHPQEMQL